MYCPNCGQQQISEEMKFCSRCGLALSGLAEWLAGGRLPLKRAEEAKADPLSPRRKGMRRAAKVMFFSGVLFPIFLVFSIAIEEPGPMFVPFMVFFVSLVMMLYARLFSDKTVPVNTQSAQTTTFHAHSVPNYLPPASPLPTPPLGRQQVRTNDLAQQPPSVTENTTRLLDNE